MSSPFNPLFPGGVPAWVRPSVNPGNFSPVTVLGNVVIPEVGFGEGGYGIGGYDMPTSTTQAAATPQWVTVSNK
jgi:hypothetical protein